MKLFSVSLLNIKVKDFSKAAFTVKTQNLSSTNVTIRGDMFQFTTLNGLYLSSNNPSMSSIELDLYTEIKSISARYPAVYGFPVYEYDVLDNGMLLQFRLPENLLDGNYDILYFNGAGYAKASKNTKRFTYFQVVSGIESTPIPTISQTPTPTVTIASTPTITPTSTTIYDCDLVVVGNARSLSCELIVTGFISG